MVTKNRLLLGATAVIAASFLFGCDDSAPPPKDTSGPAPATETAEPNDRQEIEQNLAGVSKEDRALVDAQKFCPVSDEKLGSMGPPVKVEANGETIFLCCKGCKKEFDADPDKFIAKVKKLRQENAGDAPARDERVHDVPPRSEPLN
jgi:YHS domain-containing protein